MKIDDIREDLEEQIIDSTLRITEFPEAFLSVFYEGKATGKAGSIDLDAAIGLYRSLAEANILCKLYEASFGNSPYGKVTQKKLEQALEVVGQRLVSLVVQEAVTRNRKN